MSNLDQIKAVVKQNEDEFSKYSFEEMESVCLHILIRFFDLKDYPMDKLSKEFSFKKLDNKFFSAELLLIDYENPYTGMKLVIDNYRISIYKQDGHVLFEKASSFPSEFLYLLKR